MSTDVYTIEAQNDKNLPSYDSQQEPEPRDLYQYLMNEISDPRVADWPLMSNPLSILIILFLYLLFVLHIGPNYMKNRLPCSLVNIMICFNIFTATGSGILAFGMLTSGYTTSLSLGCEPVDFSYNSESLSMARWVWWLMLLRIFELSDTVIFVFRKKQNQLSFLHIYHHCITVILAWIVCKYAPGGMWTFIMILNSVVHVVMYSYYLLTCLGPWMQSKITPWKQYLTRLQLLQFVIMMIHTSQALLPSCEPTRKPLAYLYMFHEIMIFYMFWNFYKKNYTTKKVD
ncbi:very long chain fatty acid elongase 1-like [Prorops nasuta]|uniref:very long chain fatty acid elongase 1-like n=1 Tax=Prorops nasuta TaxID=863751 RepID=UPI0034CEA549